MRILRACALVIAIACSAQAADGIMQYPVNSPSPSTGTELLLLLESFLFSF
jgi:hypothetical protein